MKYKIGDWVEIVSHKGCNLDTTEWGIGKVFKVEDSGESELYKGEDWLYPHPTTSDAIISSSVRPAKNKIVIDILKDL